MSEDRYIMGCQIRSLQIALDYCRKVKISELAKADPETIEKACQAIFLSISNLHTVLNQLNDQELESEAQQ